MSGDILELEDFRERRTEKLAQPFAVTGRRGYLIGHQDGAFPDMGNHLPGEMGGLWLPPVKIADGFWFGVAQPGSPETAWMWRANARSFTMLPEGVEREFEIVTANLDILAKQFIFMPENESGVIMSVTLENRAAHEVALTLSWLTRFDIQGAWWSGWSDRPDNANTEPQRNAVVAWDSLQTNWAAAMVSAQKPTNFEIGTDLWAVEQTGSIWGTDLPPERGIIDNREELRGRGVSGQLDCELKIPAHGTRTLHFAIAGGTDGQEAAVAKAQELLARREELLEEKRQSVRRVIENTPVLVSPRPDFNKVFAESSLCMDMLTFEMPGLTRGIVGGLPWFAWYFGCDSYYSIGGLLVAGQADTAKANLRLLASYARNQNGRTPHEITQSGRLFNPGNSIETAEFVRAVEQVYRWTGDRAFLDELYPVCRTGIFDYLLGDCDPHGDLLPDGAGLLELRTAEHGKKLDVACCLYQALGSLAYLSLNVGESETAARCTDLADKVRERIGRYFWVEAEQEYVWRIEPDLSVHPGEPSHSYATLEMGVLGAAEHERAARMFELLESPAHTNERGIIHPGTADFVMPIQNAIAALAEFRYNRPDKGLWYLERCAELGGYYMPWAIPEFVGEACFLQAWSSAAFDWLAVQGFFRLNPDSASGKITVQPQLPSAWDTLEVRNLNLWGNLYTLRLERTADGITFSAVQTGGTSGNIEFITIENGKMEIPAYFV
jgi:hypothetical protein